MLGEYGDPLNNKVVMPIVGQTFLYISLRESLFEDTFDISLLLFIIS